MEAENLKHLFEFGTKDYRRIEVNYRTHFTLKEAKRGWEECTLININRNLKGVGIQFHTDKEIKIDAVVTIDLSTPEEYRPTCVTGIVRWIKKTESDYIGGIELTGCTEKLKKVLP